ncbi:MAG: aminoacyl-tRNA hydrolase [Tagaea sp.]|nr:aminoacyl-tRNA hydrolase [Tagaea sp.]
MPRVIPDLDLDDRDLQWRFVRASGPGGQNVNKVSSAVELRVDLKTCRLPVEVLSRLRALAGRRVSSEDMLLVEAQEHRSQDDNRKSALAKLAGLLRRAKERPRPRKATKPTKGSKRRRVESKVKRGALKALRGTGYDED